MAGGTGLEGRTAIVTGAGNGIGRAIARRLAEEGCALGLLDLDLAAVEATAAAIGAAGGTAHALGADVSDGPGVTAAMRDLETRLGRVDILVNNAGFCKVGTLLDCSEADWRQTFGVNVDGLFHCTRAVAPGMVARGSGNIINIASWMGKSGVGAYSAYCASKFAVVSLTQSLACELGPQGVRVNAIAPGLIVETKMRDESDPQRRAQGLPTSEDRAKTIPRRRAGLPVDIANTAAFLVSDQADYITGETINVTGGLWND